MASSLCFRRGGSASRVLADKVQLAHLHMNLLNEIPNANQAFLFFEKADKMVTMNCPN